MELRFITLPLFHMNYATLYQCRIYDVFVGCKV